MKTLQMRVRMKQQNSKQVYLLFKCSHLKHNILCFNVGVSNVYIFTGQRRKQAKEHYNLYKKKMKVLKTKAAKSYSLSPQETEYLSDACFLLFKWVLAQIAYDNQCSVFNNMLATGAIFLLMTIHSKLT